nr:MAG TPA: hypothetical protein [Caudoviricetes sp.]
MRYHSLFSLNQEGTLLYLFDMSCVCAGLKVTSCNSRR